MDRGIPERGALERADLGALPLQRDGVERRPGGTQAHQERGRQPARPDGVQAEAQHGGRAHALLGGDTGQRGGLPLRGELLHVHPASPVLLHRGDELQGLALALRHQDGGQDDGQTAASGHQRPADEERGDLEPQQVCPRSERKRQVVLHEPPRAPVLRAKQPHRADRHGQLVPRAVRADPPQDQGRGRDLLHVHGGEAHQLQPLLHGRLQVQRGEEGQHQDAAAGAVEGRGREGHEDGERRAGQCGVGVHPPDTTEPGHRPLVRHLLRVHAERLPEGAGCKGHQGEPGGFQHRQLPDHAAAVLQGRALRLPAELEREHRPAAQAVHRI